jgi:hypothetical protein
VALFVMLWMSLVERFARGGLVGGVGASRRRAFMA